MRFISTFMLFELILFSFLTGCMGPVVEVTHNLPRAVPISS